MKKKTLYILPLAMASLAMTSCVDNWLTEPSPGITKLEDFYTSGQTALQSVNAAYTPLMWEYDGATYLCEWYIGDVMSDDALKGGQNVGDMSVVYDMENFKVQSNNALLLGFYRAQYQGIARCNLVLDQVAKMEPDTTMNVSLQQRILGEASFLRALYYFRLVRVFGGVPYVDFIIDSPSKWQQPRATAEEVYGHIIDDLTFAQKTLWEKNAYAAEDLGRATKGAAEAMLLKVNLYCHNYAAAEAWGDSIISKNQYDLCADYGTNFLLEGENGIESVFEIQYMEDKMSDYGEGFGFTRGTFTTVLTRTRAEDGWGFNKPTQNLYDEFETGDPRRDLSILNPQGDLSTVEYYLGNRYLNRKYALVTIADGDTTYYKLSHPTRSPINTKYIRFADVLLMHAEACCENGNLAAAKESLERVRSRARNMQDDPTVLPAFPYGSYSDTPEGLRDAIRHERRVELAMEGHRWFDLCRWGVACEVMEAYKAQESEEVRAEMGTFIKGVHELLPIPQQEIDLNPMEQNPGY